MLSYADDFATRAEKVHVKLPADVNPHLARSCFAALLQNSHIRAQSEGTSHEDFRSNITDAINQLGIPIFSEIDGRDILPGKRQPSLIESFDATLDRYIAIDDLKDVMSDVADSVVYGGSMKYGPFLNVRSGTDASDIDAIALVDEEVLDELDLRGVMETDLFDERDKITFFARLSLQRALIEENLVDITSQRFALTNKGFTLSMHFVPTNFMHEAYPVSAISSAKNTQHKYVRDYKERPFERTHVSNYDMDGNLHDIPVYNTPTSGGFIASNPAYSIIKGRYVPGMYQNLTLPSPKFLLGQSSRSAEHLRMFSAAIKVQEESENHLYEGSSVLNTEPRKPILPLDVSDILDE